MFAIRAPDVRTGTLGETKPDCPTACGCGFAHVPRSASPPPHIGPAAHASDARSTPASAATMTTSTTIRRACVTAKWMLARYRASRAARSSSWAASASGEDISDLALADKRQGIEPHRRRTGGGMVVLLDP